MEYLPKKTIFWAIKDVLYYNPSTKEVEARGSQV
jgi:hypothetical protein